MFRKTDPETIAPYLKDASNFSEGQASEVIIPETLEELVTYINKFELSQEQEKESAKLKHLQIDLAKGSSLAVMTARGIPIRL